MAETNEPNKSVDPNSATSSEPPAPSLSRLRDKDEDEERIDINSLPEMSADEIDSVIEESDPEFVKALKGISEDKTLTVEQIIVDDIDAALHAEIDVWKNSGGLKSTIYKIFPFAPRLSFRFKLLKFRLSAWVQGQSIRFKNFLYFLATDGRNQISTFLQKKKKHLLQNLNQFVTTFRKLKLQTKLILVASIVLFLTAFVVLYLIAAKKGLLPGEKQYFVINLADFATKSYEYDPETQVEPYIDNPRAIQNLILIQKMVVNLKPSKNSGPNPMLAAEFFVEGMSADVVVEIKDREVMIRDLMQRTLEQLTYDQIDTPDGKREMLTLLQKEISRVTTTGRVKNVRIKTIVIKP